MQRGELLEKMREDYRKMDLKSLQRHFQLGQWLLTPEDKQKVTEAIKTLESECLHPKVTEALKILPGAKLVSVDKS